MPREKGEEWKHVTVLSAGDSRSGVKMARRLSMVSYFISKNGYLRFFYYVSIG